jgi:acetolactate synthase-1/2/3 large subunit
MKVTDYIVEFLIEKKVTDIFGYPGGVICHFMDSVTKYPEQIQAHINYHEQAAAFAACGYAQESGNIGVAFSTSGPGATNLVTGIANAYFDSTPVIFLTGQVDTYGLKGNLPIRQRGFQETDMVSITKSITKYAVRVDDPKKIRYELEKAFHMATEKNPGPVLLDLPADVQRAEIDEEELESYENVKTLADYHNAVVKIAEALKLSKRPILLVGNGVKESGMTHNLREFVEEIQIPVVFSMPAFDTLPYSNKYNYGFIGANGHRYGNFILGKSDLIISLGSRMDLKQVGNNREAFVPDARFIRIDIDEGNLKYVVHKVETQIVADIKELLPTLYNELKGNYKCSDEWNDICGKIKEKLYGYDDETYTIMLNEFGRMLPDNITITLDVGQSEVWVAQQLQVKRNQSVHMSAGHGSMGYSLPAAIGSYYVNKRPVFSFNGDGGIQMNIQELQYLKRERIPVHVIIINNHALGMIRGFQEANFNKNYTQTIEGSGYLAPDFLKIAEAYSLQYIQISSSNDIEKMSEIDLYKPSIIELTLPVETALNPNFGANGMIQDQRPYMDRKLFDSLMSL